jgi:hypothetical protein
MTAPAEISLPIALAARKRALESRLKALRANGQHAQASQCADLILELVGKRPSPLPAVIA